MKNNLISIVLTLYNEEKYYAIEAIESILQQTYDTIELILILDNPNNKELVGLIREYEKKDRRVKSIINEKNIGLSESLNKGIKYAKGEYIARMDGDDISYRDRLEIQLKYLIDNNYDFVGSNAELINENGEVIWKTSHGELKYDDIVKKLKYKNIFIHPSILFKRKMLQELNGYYDIKYIEDYELFTRAIINKFTCGILEQNLIKYRIRNGSITNSNALIQLLLENRIKMYYRKALKNKKNYRLDYNIKVSDEEKQNYSKAFENFKDARESFGKKNYIDGFLYVIKSAIKSKYILCYIKNIVLYKIV